MELSAEALALIAANGRGEQSDATKCHFCGFPGRHLYVFVERESAGAAHAADEVLIRGEYRGYCDHIDWDGNPWCDGCVMLGRDGGVAHPCCPKCCGVSWGAPDPEATPAQVGRRCLWAPAFEAAWTAARPGQ